MSDDTEKCGFEWIGPSSGGQREDIKAHQCVAAKGHNGCHECDCGTLKYAGPDPTAWRKNKQAKRAGIGTE